MPRVRNRPRRFPRRLASALTGRQPTDSPVFVLGLAGQQWAHLAGPMDADTLNTFATAGGVNRSYRPAGSLVCKSGRLLDIFVAQQDGKDDYRVGGLYQRYSTDNGQTWSPMQCIYRRETAGTPDFLQNARWIDGPVMLVQHASGRIHLQFCKSDGTSGSETKTIWGITTVNDGDTWGDGTTQARMATNPTNISAAIIKANNTTPAGIPACYTAGASSLNSPWLWAIPTDAICIESGPNAGRIVVFGDHKYTSGGNSWAHCWYTDNGQDALPTWVLGGGYEENAGNNLQTNETSGVEIGTVGSILTSSRYRAAPNDSLRAQTTITQAQVEGATWTTAAISVDGAAAQIPFSSAYGSLWKRLGKVYLACATGAGVRAHIRVYRSANNGATWTLDRAICYGYAGYCHGHALPNGQHRILFERTHNFAIESFSAQYVTQARFNEYWFEHEAQCPDVHEWNCNEGEFAAATIVGNQLMDVGANGSRSFDARGFHRGNTSYVQVGSRWCLNFLGSGAGAYLQEAQDGAHGGPCDAGLRGLTFEFAYNLPAGGSPGGIEHVLFDNRNDSAGKGMTIKLNTSGQWVATVSDGTNTKSTTAGGADRFDGADHVCAVVVDRAGNLSVFDTTTGVAVLDGTAINMTAVTLDIRGTLKGMLGRQATTDGKHMPAGSKIDAIRVTHKAITTGWMEGWSRAKMAYSTWIGTRPALPVIANFPSTPTIHLFTTHDLGYNAYADLKNSTGVGGARDHVPWGSGIIKLGQGAKAMRDNANDRPFALGNSENQGAWIDFDNDIGYHWRVSWFSTSGSGGALAVLPTTGVPAFDVAYDYIQETGVFCFYICYKTVTDVTFGLFDTTGGAANNGFTAYQASGGGNNLWMRYVNSTPTALNENITTIGNLPTGSWVNLMITGNGSGKFQLFKAVTTGRVVGSITGPTNNPTGNITAPGLLSSSATPRPLGIGIRGSDGAGLAGNIRVKNAILAPAWYGANSNAFAACCAMSAAY